MSLPSDFIALMRSHLGADQAEALFRGLQEPPTVSVRFNPRKAAYLSERQGLRLSPALTDPVPWCPDAYYLPERYAFTFDPLFHAGVYYVQDASSMYLAEVLRKYLPSINTIETIGTIATPLPVKALDLCAAPGGKSTLLASLLPEGSTLISNEPIRKRAQVLAENMQKWAAPMCDGLPGVGVTSVVTQNYPDEFGHFHDTFDLILADVPCSGEGMFRKDEEAIREWSLENVRQCVERQRGILRAIMPTLKAGGLLIYSTCTFNRHEDEGQVEWLARTYNIEVLAERHFFPGRDRGEGLYMAVLRSPAPASTLPIDPNDPKVLSDLKAPKAFSRFCKTLNVMPQQNVIDASAPRLELDYQQAIAYLRREALHLQAPRGPVAVTYRGLPLGMAKSVGSRLNNLYPPEWRIRTTYTPSEPLPDFFVEESLAVSQ